MSEISSQNSSEKVIHEKGSLGKILTYASPRFGIGLFIGLIDISLLFLYKNVYELDPNKVGIGLMLGKFSIAISQFVFGWISDHTHTRWGRRKPYIFILTPILAFSFIMLLLPGIVLGNNPDKNNLFLWFILFNCLAQISYALTTVYHSWTAEQFPVEQRPKVSLYQNMFNFISTAIVVLFSMIVLTDVNDKLKEDPTKIPTLYLSFIILFTAILFILNYFCIIKIPVEKTPEYRSKLIDDLKTIINNKNLLLVCLMQGICSFTWAMSQSVLLSYAEEVLKLTGTMYIGVAAAMILTMIGALYFWKKYIENHGKLNSLLLVFGSAIIVLPFSVLGYFEFSTSILFGLPFIMLIAIALGGWYLFPYIIYADIAEDDQKETGELKAGIYSGFPAIILNIFQAFSLRFTGWILSWDTIQNVPGTEPFSKGLIFWGPIGAGILTIALIYAKKFIRLDFDWEKK